MSNVLHLIRRAVSSLRNHPVDQQSRDTASAVLLPVEFEMWSRMQNRDQRHSLAVLARFDALLPSAGRAERAAALLHDVGKSASNLGWLMRVIATVVGPRTRRFAEYADHEAIGARMLSGVSDELTVLLVSGRAVGHVADALRAADEI